MTKAASKENSKPKLLKWRPIQLPKEIMRDLEVFAESGISRSLGFTNKSQIAAFAIRDFLAKYSEYISIYQITDISEKEVKMIDHELNTVVKLTVNYEEDPKGGLFCDVDKKPYCEHIKFALRLPGVLRYMKKHGYDDDVIK